MKADMILKSSRIFTALSGETISGGVAVRGNRIIAVGQEALALEDPDTEIRDYGGRLIMPGFVDAHVHYFVGAIAASDHVCDTLAATTSEADCVNMIKKFAEEHPDEKRVTGHRMVPCKLGRCSAAYEEVAG